MSNKITHEQMREHLKGIFNINEAKYEYIRLITNYIIQQEKQEKLLQLYRRLVNQNLQVNLHILEKIKELENEKE